MKINYITNQCLSSTSGGWSGISANIYNNLKNKLEINYIGPVTPKSVKYEKLFSKINRIIGLKGDFHFFSEKRLDKIKQIVNSKLKESQYNFYFGQTPWIKCENDVSYGTYMDASFLTYMEIYSTPDKFRKKDLLRIAKKEELWLQKADDIFIGSEWAWQEMIKHYDLDEKKKVVVHTGGNIEIPKQQNYNGKLNFVFISLDFEKKGGPICVKAFNKIHKNHPNATLTIIGQKPPDNILKNKNIIYAGFLRKTHPKEHEKFKQILAEAFLLIHPTVMDTMGAVLIEAAYYGCPSIAPKSFGIPELVIHNKTGLIVDVPFSETYFYTGISHLIESKDKYIKMREEARKYSMNNLTWEVITTKINNRINEHINS